MIVEIVVYNFESALQAQRGNADRIELCENPAEGGTTPSAGMIEAVRKNLNCDVFVMIRPRGGDFLYSAFEYEAMKHDIMTCKRLGVDGVVFGILTAEGVLDKVRNRELVQLARPMKVTCHRAFDLTRNSMQALDDCLEIGFDRILTSGHQEKAIDGVDEIANLIKRAENKIVIMPGSGVNEETVVPIVTRTGAKEIHFSALAYRDSEMQFQNNDIKGMGADKDAGSKIRTVDPARIQKIKSLAEGKH